MPDAPMPERVWLTGMETAWEPGHFTETEPDGRNSGQCPVYVPESKLAAAERERDALREELADAEQGYKGWRENYKKLRADLAALLPLARWGLQEADGVMPESQGTLTEEAIAAGRAIIEREGK